MSWLEPLTKGSLMGFALAFLIGPVFFALIRVSMEKGLRAASVFAAGIAASDVVALSLSYFLIAGLSDKPWFGSILGYVGGAILCTFGLVDFFRKPKIKDPQKIRFSGPLSLLGKGFLLNAINPFVYLFWIGIVAAVKTDKHMDGTGHLVFFTSMIATVFLTDVLKSWAATHLSKLLSERVLSLVTKVLGIGLFLFGLRMIWFGASGH